MTTGTPLAELDLLTGEEELVGALSGFDQSVDAHRDRFFEALDQAFVGPMREAFDQAHQAHSRLLTEAGLTRVLDEGPPAEPEGGTAAPLPPSLGGKRLRRYREGVRSEVLEPLGEALRALEIGTALNDRWTGFLNGLPLLADGLPDQILRLEPLDLFDAKREDGAFSRSRKAVIRGWRTLGKGLSTLGQGAFRLVGGRVAPPRPKAQRVPLRSLARDCLLGRCPLALAELGESLQQHVALPVARLETALARWSAGWYQAEEGSKLAEGHVGARFLEGVLRELPPLEEETQAAPEPVALEGNQSDPNSEGRPDVLPEIRGLCLVLDESLAFGASLEVPLEMADRMRGTLEEERRHLDEEIRVTGSFQSSGPAGRDRIRADRLAERRLARTRSWDGWHQNALGRINLAVLLLRLREGFDAAESEMMGRIVEEALAPLLASWTRVRAGLHELWVEAEALFAEWGPGEGFEDLGKKIGGLSERASALVESELTTNQDSPQPRTRVLQIADAVAERLGDGLRFLPESITVSLRQEEDDMVDPTKAPRELLFREVVRQTVDVLRLESIRNSPEPLLIFLDGAAGESAEIPNIVSFNLNAARDELLTPPEGPAESIFEDARSLTLEGLTRTSGGLDGLLHGLASAWTEFSANAHRLLEESYAEVHSRAVAEGAVEEQMLGLRANVNRWFRQGIESARGFAERVIRRLRRLLRRARVRVARLVRLGRSAVGVATTQEGEAERALEILMGVPSLLEGLPLVYRRLYSFQPVTDPKLLIGRKSEMDWAIRRKETWTAGFGVPNLLAGPVGGGYTSFLNVFSASGLEEFEVHRLELTERVGSEESLAGLLSGPLGSGERGGVWSFERLEARVHTRAARAKPLAVLIEHLEYVLLRTPGGTDLLARFLSFQAQTSEKIFWLSTVPGATRKFLEKSDPSSAGLLAQKEMTLLSCDDMEEMIMSRHRRSGLPVEFLQPTDVNPLLRRKLRLTRQENARQTLIRKEYFDRIYRMSEGSIAMAILFWLRSTDFTSREGWLRVSPPRPIRFVYMESLDLSADFALKAFLEHGSLTLEEYGVVFQASEEDAFQLFEALRSRSLLEPLGSGGGVPSQTKTVREGVRYRIPGILSQVVASRLKNRNILH